MQNLQNLNLDAYGVNEIEEVEMVATDGGFFPIIIGGVVLLTSAETFACFCVGVGVGAAVAQGQK